MTLEKTAHANDPRRDGARKSCNDLTCSASLSPPPALTPGPCWSCGSGSASGAAGVQDDGCDELSLMGFTPEEVTAAKAEVDESQSQSSQGSCRTPAPCIDCEEYNENCFECREEALMEAQSRRQAAAEEKQQRQTWARMAAEGNADWCDDCGQYDEECAGCRAAMRQVEEDMRERQEMRRAAVGGRRVRS